MTFVKTLDTEMWSNVTHGKGHKVLVCGKDETVKIGILDVGRQKFP